MMRKTEIFKIHSEYIKLGDLLKACGAVETGGQAKQLVLRKKVKVNGEICEQRGKKIKSTDCVETDDMEIRVE